MRGDFSRTTFHPENQYSRVLKQQGRVELDADWNEQVAIGLHQLRTLAADLIGGHGGPMGNVGFKIEPATSGPKNAEGEFSIGAGRYYVDGILCENDEPTSYFGQAHRTKSSALATGAYLAYLDVWEREVTPIEDPRIREVALGGPETALRARVVWRVRVAEVESEFADKFPDLTNKLEELNKYFRDNVLGGLQPAERGKLSAQAVLRPGRDARDPCDVSPEAKYRGFENQLYRVEIQRVEEAKEKTKSETLVTFRWSRDNGSIVFPILDLDGDDAKTLVTVAHLGKDDRSTLTVGDWVEIADETTTLDPPEDPKLLRITHIDRPARVVTLSGRPDGDVGRVSTRSPLLRRWDRRAGAAADDDAAGSALDGVVHVATGRWIELEDGVQIRFEKDGTFLRGDYWQIAARTATADVEWPRTPNGDPIAQTPHGVIHHYAPLAYLGIETNKLGVFDLRRQFEGLSKPFAP
jgi:hypothetical protein